MYGPTPEEVRISDADNARSLVLTKDKAFPDLVPPFLFFITL